MNKEHGGSPDRDTSNMTDSVEYPQVTAMRVQISTVDCRRLQCSVTGSAAVLAAGSCHEEWALRILTPAA